MRAVGHVTAGSAPCATGQTCGEAADECRTMCEVTNDADGDGSRAPNCGGTDCDDSNPRRFPGNDARPMRRLMEHDTTKWGYSTTRSASTERCQCNARGSDRH